MVDVLTRLHEGKVADASPGPPMVHIYATLMISNHWHGYSTIRVNICSSADYSPSPPSPSGIDWYLVISSLTIYPCKMFHLMMKMSTIILIYAADI